MGVGSEGGRRARDAHDYRQPRGERYRLSPEELAAREARFDQYGIRGLQITRPQDYCKEDYCKASRGKRRARVQPWSDEKSARHDSRGSQMSSYWRRAKFETWPIDTGQNPAGVHLTAGIELHPPHARTAAGENRGYSIAGDLNGSWRTPCAAGRTAVIITIDAEIAPHTSDWKRDRGRFALDRDVYGINSQGERGLRYQLEVLERHGLTGVVFVEALSAGVLGFDLLEEIVGLVQDRGHEVALHIHTEWLPYYARPLLGDRFGTHMREFSEDDQQRLIDQGLENLTRAGARRVIALRAGNCGASDAPRRGAQRHPDRLQLFRALLEWGLSIARGSQTLTTDAPRRRARSADYVVSRRARPDPTGPDLRLLEWRVRAPPLPGLEPRLECYHTAIAQL
jgi:hypothetical protein